MPNCWLEVSTHSEGPATGQLDQGFPWFSSVLEQMLKQNLVYILFKNPVRTAKKTQLFTITKINWLTLFKEIIAVYIENHYKMQNY
jgi:hypothetical protein